MQNETAAVETLSKEMIHAAQFIMESVPADRTIRAKITEHIGGHIYKISIKGAIYKAPFCLDETLSVGDSVWVMVPQNNWNDIFIYAKAVNI